MISTQRFARKPRGATAPSFIKARKPLRTARSRQHGLTFPDRDSKLSGLRGEGGFEGATLEKGLTDGWIISSKEAVYECQDSANQVAFGPIWNGRERKDTRTAFEARPIAAVGQSTQS